MGQNTLKSKIGTPKNKRNNFEKSTSILLLLYLEKF